MTGSIEESQILQWNGGDWVSCVLSPTAVVAERINVILVLSSLEIRLFQARVVYTPEYQERGTAKCWLGAS